MKGEGGWLAPFRTCVDVIIKSTHRIPMDVCLARIYSACRLWTADVFACVSAYEKGEVWMLLTIQCEKQTEIFHCQNHRQANYSFESFNSIFLIYRYTVNILWLSYTKFEIVHIFMH